jgi:hypothetical protein
MKTAGWGVLAVVGVIVLAIALTAFGLAWRYAWSGPSGAVGAREQQQNATNRVQQQAKFEQMAADYDGYLIQIQTAEVALKNSSAETREMRETELLGLRQICVTAAQDFNAESNKYLARVWKSAGLPATLDPTACQG